MRPDSIRELPSTPPNVSKCRRMLDMPLLRDHQLGKWLLFQTFAWHLHRGSISLQSFSALLEILHSKGEGILQLGGHSRTKMS